MTRWNVLDSYYLVFSFCFSLVFMITCSPLKNPVIPLVCWAQSFSVLLYLLSHYFIVIDPADSKRLLGFNWAEFKWSQSTCRYSKITYSLPRIFNYLILFVIYFFIIYMSIFYSLRREALINIFHFINNKLHVTEQSELNI